MQLTNEPVNMFLNQHFIKRKPYRYNHAYLEPSLSLSASKLKFR